MATRVRGLVGDWVRFPHVAQDLMKDPDAFFKQHEIKESDWVCPPEVHEALERGRKLGEAVKASCTHSEKNKLSLPEHAKELKKAVEGVFGKDFIAETIPFGLLFKERAKSSSGGSVGAFITATGSCTFCTDSDSPDVD